MNLEDAIRKAMEESIRNAEQWLRDARLLMENGSFVHGSVLRDIGGEELAKAYACWKALVCAIPLNHPLVRANQYENLETRIEKLKKEGERDQKLVEKGKKPKTPLSVFASHRAKNALVSELGYALFQSEFERLGIARASESNEKNRAALGALLAMLGEAGTMKRSEWMYVNLFGKDEEYEIQSPMEIKLDTIDSELNLSFALVDLVKSLASAPLEKAVPVAMEERNLREKSDAYYPNDPRWAKGCGLEE